MRKKNNVTFYLPPRAGLCLGTWDKNIFGFVKKLTNNQNGVNMVLPTSDSTHARPPVVTSVLNEQTVPAEGPAEGSS